MGLKNDIKVQFPQDLRLRMHEMLAKRGIAWLQAVTGESREYKLKAAIEGVEIDVEVLAKVHRALATYDASRADESAPASAESTKSADVMRYRAFEVATRSLDVAARSIDFVCSTSTEDRYGDCVEQTWRLESYNRNPVVLYAHRSRDSLPIGRAEKMRVTGTGTKARLECTVVFASEKANPLAEQVFQLCCEGVLKAVSVGFIPGTTKTEVRDGRQVTVLGDNELVELSVTPVPANPEALAKSAPLAAPRSAPPAAGVPMAELARFYVEPSPTESTSRDGVELAQFIRRRAALTPAERVVGQVRASLAASGRATAPTTEKSPPAVMGGEDLAARIASKSAARLLAKTKETS